MSSHASSAVAQHQIMETIPQLEQQQAQQTNSNHQQQAHQQQHHQQQHHQQQHHQQAQVQQAMMAALMASGFNVNVNSAQAAAQVQAQVQAQAQAASQMAMQNMQLPVGGQSVPVQGVSTSSMQQSTGGGGGAPVNPFAIVNNVNYISAPQPAPVSNASIQQQQHHHQGQEQVTTVSAPAGAGSSQTGQVVVQQQQHQNCAVPANVPSQPFNVNVNNNAMAAAAAQVVAAHSAAAAQQQASANTNTRNNIVQHAGGVPSVVGVNIKNWKLSQLEAHAQLLRDTNQTIPQAVALLLADARRKEEKRTAKRVANRKSACTSRARKKALVEEMTKVNAILKRQAMILALLPDLVIAIQADGEITFCSEQVERVLRHNNEHLVGANINQILVPKSQLKLKQLVEQIVTAEQQASTTSNVEEQELPPSPQPNTNNNGKQIIIQPSNQVPTIAVAANADNSLSGSAQSGVVSANGVAVVSEQSFPLRVVKLEAENREQPEGENSDLSTSNGGSKNTTAAAVAVAAPGKKQSQTSSDEYTSSDTKGLRMANEALSRNVRWHNEKMQSCKAPRAKSHTDDVNGAFVTANNADARLSSLEHIHLENTTMNNNNNATMGASYEDQSLSTSSNDSLLAGVEEKKKRGINKRRRANGESSDDSGYRESNDESQSSREDTSSDTETSRNDKDRPKPLAPTCNVCLIRDDLTTIWCEVTSSIRTRSLKEEDESNPFSDTISSAVMTTTTSLESSEEKGTESVPSQPSGADEIKELLLCLRPIRDGEEKVDESLRFATVPTSSTSLPIEHDVVVSENNAMTGNTPAPSSELTPNTSSGSGNSAFNTNDSAGSTQSVNSPVAKMTEQMKMRPPKKRRIREQPQAVVVPLMTGSSDKMMSPPKICSPESNAKKENLSSTTAREQSVVESLMLMSHNC